MNCFAKNFINVFVNGFVKDFVKMFTVLALGVFTGVYAFAAVLPQEDKSFFFADSTEKTSYELHYLPRYAVPSDTTRQPAVTRILVLFRARYDALNFEKTDAKSDTKTDIKSDAKPAALTFVAHPVLNVEFTDGDGVIRADAVWRGTVTTDALAKTASKTEFVAGQITLLLPAGKYTLAVDLGDKAVPRLVKLREKNVLVPNLVLNSALNLAPNVPSQPNGRVFADKPIFGAGVGSSDGAHFSAFGLGAVVPMVAGAALRSERGATTASVTNSVTKALWGLVGVRRGSEYSCVIQRIAAPVGALPFAAVSGSVLFHRDSTVCENDSRGVPTSQRLSLCGVAGTAALNSVAGAAVAEIALPAEAMDEGEYELVLTERVTPDNTGSRSDTLRSRFRVQWMNKPRSLRNFEYALDVARYIMNDSEYNATVNGSQEQVRERFAAFWRQIDPTPATAFNEAFAAYYKRVDEAFFRFSQHQALNPVDGAKSERGKVFILCGEPTSVDITQLSNGSTQERWRYSNGVKKEFVFEVQRNGVSVLKSVVE